MDAATQQAPDITKVSDADLQNMLGSAPSANAPASSDSPAPSGDITKLSDAELQMQLNKTQGQPDTMANMGPINYAQQHPFKTVLQPAAKTITGTSAEDFGHQVTAPQESMDLANPVNYWTQVAKEAVAGTVGGVADAYTTPANYALAPLAKGALSVVGKGMEALPQGMKDASGRLYNWMVRLPTKAFNYDKDPLDVLAQEKLPGNSITELAQHAEDRLNLRSLQLDQAVKGSDKTVDLSDIVPKHLDDASTKAEGSLQDRTAMLAKLQTMGDKITEQYGDLTKVPVAKAIQLKRQLADDFPFSGDAEGNILAKTAHSMYHDINQAVETEVPEIADLNHRVSGLIDISKAARNRMAVESRNNPIGIIATILGTGVGAGMGHGIEGGVVGLSTALMAKAVTSPAVLTRVAGTLSNMSEIDKINLYKAAPWFMNIAQKATDFISKGGKLAPEAQDAAEPVEAELLGGKNYRLPAPAKVNLRADRALPMDVGDNRVMTTPVQEGQSIKGLPPSKTTYGDNFTIPEQGSKEVTSGNIQDIPSNAVKLSPNEQLIQSENNPKELTNLHEATFEDKAANIRMQGAQSKQVIQQTQDIKSWLKGKINTKELSAGEFQDMSRQSKFAFSDKGSGLDDVASEMFNAHPEWYPPGFTGHPSDALRKVIDETGATDLTEHRTNVQIANALDRQKGKTDAEKMINLQQSGSPLVKNQGGTNLANNKGSVRINGQNPADPEEAYKTFKTLSNDPNSKTMGMLGPTAAAGTGIAALAGAKNANANSNTEDQKKMGMSAVNYTKDAEGFSGSMYKDSKGQSVGYGFNTGNAAINRLIPADVKSGDREMTKPEADAIFPKAYNIARNDAIQFVGNRTWNNMNDTQKKGITDMSYNMGSAKLNEFQKLKVALQGSNWKQASKEVLNSNYAKELPDRARRNSILVGKVS